MNARTPSKTTAPGWSWGPPPVELPPALGADLRFPRWCDGDDEPGDHLEDFADDLERWLSDHPEDRERFSGGGAWIAYRVAVKLAASGLAEIALHYFEFGESLRPDFPDLHINHAVALHALGRESEALDHYEKALRFLDPLRDAHVFHLAALLHHRNHRPDRARQLMEQALPALPDDEAFWDLWAELAPESGTVDLAEVEEPSASVRQCPQCGNEVTTDARFCGGCGQALNASPEPRCPSCGEPLSADAKFCGRCGTKRSSS